MEAKMTKRNAIKLLALLGLPVLVILLLAACGGVSQSEFDATKQQLLAQDQKVTGMQQQLSGKEKEVADLQQQLSAKDKELAEQQSKAAAAASGSGSVKAVIGYEPKPTFTPAPPPTPLPPGVTPPPRPAPPSTLYDSVGPYAFYVETLTSGKHPSKYGLEPTVACVLNGVFKRGMKIVWRFEIIDSATGKRLTDKDEPTIKIHLPNGEDLTARFSQRAGGRNAPDAPYMWAAGWDIPPDYPLGAFDYNIVVTTKDGKTVTWKVPALVQNPGLDSRVQIVD
jgi:hypothetical protein